MDSLNGTEGLRTSHDTFRAYRPKSKQAMYREPQHSSTERRVTADSGDGPVAAVAR